MSVPTIEQFRKLLQLVEHEGHYLQIAVIATRDLKLMLTRQKFRRAENELFRICQDHLFLVAMRLYDRSPDCATIHRLSQWVNDPIKRSVLIANRDRELKEDVAKKCCDNALVILSDLLTGPPIPVDQLRVLRDQFLAHTDPRRTDSTLAVTFQAMEDLSHKLFGAARELRYMLDNSHVIFESIYDNFQGDMANFASRIQENDEYRDIVRQNLAKFKLPHKEKIHTETSPARLIPLLLVRANEDA
ncbi:MAG: hypothetical protein ABL962_01440 [Fimbriimonadaceae bacterium]